MSRVELTTDLLEEIECSSFFCFDFVMHAAKMIRIFSDYYSGQRFYFVHGEEAALYYGQPSVDKSRNISVNGLIVKSIHVAERDEGKRWMVQDLTHSRVSIVSTGGAFFLSLSLRTLFLSIFFFFSLPRFNQNRCRRCREAQENRTER